MRARDSLHDDGGDIDVSLDRLVGEDAATVDVNLVANGNVVTENSYVLKTGPLADRAVPADNRALDPGMVLDFGSSEEDAALEPYAIANNDTGTNGDIRTDTAVFANLRGGVNQDVATVDVRLRGRCEKLGVPLGEGGEIKAGTSEEVLGLTDIHPETVQIKGVEVTVVHHGGEDLLLDRGRTELNPIKDRGIEDIHAGVDSIADKLDGLLDKAIDERGVARLVNNDTVLGRLLNLGDNNGTFLAMALVELGKILEGEVANHIGVEDKEGLVILGEGLFGKLERTGSVKGLILDGEGDIDTVLLTIL